ncbi:hypothetical protein SAMN05660284_01824 [Formivibrio citricus]|uniref:YtkA-like n=1 Tax=Formivibrio citricus TaxID=83765 RepID=A0A1I5A644_9NEIS|nr:hypothetical protein [Formivibrio citricus]SFN57925.1 hypothetical protein SAMN05660284_01824 [Formivibrio citricus]
MPAKESNQGFVIAIGAIFAWLTLASPVQSQDHDAHGQHGAPAPAGASQRIEAKLSAPDSIRPNQQVPLTVQVQDAQGQRITAYERFQEALMHMIVVSDDLRFFNHLHPEHDGNGNFKVTTRFPAPGAYTLFCDYKPAGRAEQVSVLKLAVPGAMPVTPAIDTATTVKHFAQTTVTLGVSPAQLKAATDTLVTFDLRQKENGQPVADLQPYLGEKGHLVIIKQSSPLSGADYIHAHALKEGNGAAVQFMTRFPRPGLYKLWGQFNRGGTILTADFWVDVKPH